MASHGLIQNSDSQQRCQEPECTAVVAIRLQMRMRILLQEGEGAPEQGPKPLRAPDVFLEL